MFLGCLSVSVRMHSCVSESGVHPEKFNTMCYEPVDAISPNFGPYKYAV